MFTEIILIPQAMQEDMPSEMTTKNKNEKEKRERRKERG